MTTSVSHSDAPSTSLVLGAATGSGKSLAFRLIAQSAALEPLAEPTASSTSTRKPSNLERLS